MSFSMKNKWIYPYHIGIGFNRIKNKISDKLEKCIDIFIK